MTAQHPRSIAHFLVWFGLVPLIIFAAVVLSITRLALPHAASYRGQVEQWISESIGQPVQLATFDAELLDLTPTLIFNDAQLLDAPGGSPVVRCDELRVGLDLMATLRQRRPVLAELTLVGVDLALDRQADVLRLRGLSRETAPAASDDDSAVGQWLLRQGVLAIRDSRLLFTDGSESFEFEGVQLELRNSGGRHRLTGSAGLPQHLGQRVQFALDLTGDVFQPHTTSGRIYLKGEQLLPAALRQYGQWKEWQAAQGTLSFRLWGQWENGALHEVSGDTQAVGLRITRERAAIDLPAASARLHWRRQTAGGWALQLADLRLTGGGRAWEPTELDLLSSGEGYQLRMGYLRIEDLMPFLPLVPAIALEQLAAAAPSGDLRDLQLAFDAQSGLQLNTAFHRIGVRPRAGFPGVQGLSGEFRYGPQGGRLSLASHDAYLDHPTLFREPIAITRLAGSLWLNAEPGGWRLDAPRLTLANDDVAVDASLALSLPEQGRPHMELIGAFRDGRAERVAQYLPVGIMSSSLIDWLDNAFHRGRVESGGFVLRGHPADFPFRHGEGQFEVGFTAAGVDLLYREGWPRLSNIEAEARFSGSAMSIKANAAEVSGAKVAHTQISIADFRKPVLVVDGETEGTLGNHLGFLVDAGLAGGMAKTLADARSAGRTSLRLGLRVPLHKGSETFTLRGEARLAQARLRLDNGLDLQDTSGRLVFTEQSFSGENLRGQMFGRPVAITVYTEGSGEKRTTHVAALGGIEATTLRQQFSVPLLSHLSGAADWQGRLVIAHETGETHLTVGSELQGLASNLPEPLAKPASLAWPTQFSAHLSGPRQGEIQVSVRDVLAAALRLLPGAGVERGTIHFGSGSVELPQQPSLWIVGRLPRLLPKQWSTVLATAPPSAATTTVPALVVQLEELGLVFAEKGDADGEVKSGAPRAGPSRSELPPISVAVERLTYNGMPLGALRFHTEAAPQAMLLRDFQLQGNAYSLTAQGQWQQGKDAKTELETILYSANVGAMMDELGVASVIERGKGTITASLHWPGSLLDFDIPRLVGNIEVDLRDGRINDVDPGAGRLLGLLSVQALPRRLLLDFRDVFDKGMRFDRIRGTVTVENGNAHTDSMRMDAVAAQVLLTGRTGLVSRDFDQRITVEPEVSSSLPVAGGLALGPQVGAALLLFQRLFRSQLDGAAAIRYQLTGSWDAPVMTRLD